MNSRISSVLMVVILVLGSFIGLISFEPGTVSALPSHNRIHIEGNSNFTLVNGVTSGNGTPMDPYVIEGYNITTPLSYSVEIRNTTKHFVIRDMYVHNSSIGIYLYNVTNGIIRNSNASDSWGGIYLVNSNNITIINNNIHNNTRGITPSDLCSIISNNITGNDLGIYKLDGRNIDIMNNNISNNDDGIAIDGSKNYNITGNNITGNDRGIYTMWSFRSSFITENNILDNGIGLYIPIGYKINITDNNISFNDRTFIAGVRNSNISRNTVLSNNNTGIEIHSAQNNILNNIVYSNNGYGINLMGSDTNVITGNKIFNNNLFGLNFDGSSYNAVTDNMLESNIGGGIAIHESTYNTLSKNTMSSNGIFLNAFSQNHWDTHTIDTTNTVNGKPVYFWKAKVGGTVPAGAGQVILVNCKLVNITNQDLSNGTIGIELAYSYNNIIDNNVIGNNNNDGIYLIFSKSNLLTNNTSINNTSGIYLAGSNYNYLTRNIVNSNRGSGISLFESRNNRLENNTSSFNGYNGINLNHFSTDSIIKNNICNSNGNNGISLNFQSNAKLIEGNICNFNKNNGIYVWESFSMSFNNNTFNSNGMNGISLVYSFGIILQNSIIKSNNQHGIFLDYSDNSQIIDNEITSNIHSGIYFNNSDSVHVINSTISFNQFGIYFYGSRNNYFYHNSFINNNIQISVLDKNYWDDNYPSGGNFWSDYTGFDNYRNVSQDLPGSDGVGDSPYVINALNEDDYPLMKPYYPVPPSMPQNLKAEIRNDTNDYSYVELTWQAPAYEGNYPLLNYNIYRGEKQGDESFYRKVENISSFLDEDIIIGITYYYKVSAENIIGEGLKSIGANITAITFPDRPTNLEIQVFPFALNISWSPPPFYGGSPITNYFIYKGTLSGNITFLTEIGNGLFYNDTNVTGGVKYYYRISAKNAVGEGQLSKKLYATAIDVPTKPVDLVAANEIYNIYLNWTAPEFDGGSPVTNYRIYKSTMPDIELSSILIGTKTEYSDPGVTRGIRYYYRVSAVNARGESEKSEQVMGVLSGVPQAPLNLTAEAGDSFVNLTWSEPEFDGGDSIFRYYIYRGTVPGEEEAIDRVWNDTLFYNDTGVINDEVYYYKLCAMNKYGKGSFTSSVRAIPKEMTQIIITNEAPKAQIVMHIYNATWKAPLTVNFNGSGFDSDGTIVSYLWDFGDGNKSSEQNPVHTYTVPGTYYVKLTVIDNDGDLDVTMVTLVVEPEQVEQVDDTEKKIKDEEKGKGSFWLLVAGGALSMIIAFFILLLTLWPMLMRKKDVSERQRAIKEVKIYRTQMRLKSTIEVPEEDVNVAEGADQFQSDEMGDEELEE